jgi:tetratricopeptide (TPR) repeat protein
MALLDFVKAKYGWKPSVYSELIQFFDRSGSLSHLSSLIEEGAKNNPRNALVCQALLRSQPDAQSMIQILQTSRWTSEFTDKMATTVCEILAARNELPLCRHLLAEAILQGSPGQRYKLYISAAMIELIHGDAGLTPLLLDTARRYTPFKARPLLAILLAKVCEFNGEYDQALSIFESILHDFSIEWRVWFELAQFHVHRCDIKSAQAVLSQAVVHHSGNGRLWAVRVQLAAFSGIEAQVKVLREAIHAVPKSGEVWCEAARIALNPLGEYFNLEAAHQYLEFAYRFTPQHGDSLVELIRLEMLMHGRHADFGEIRRKFVASESNYGLLFTFLRQMDERPMVNNMIREVAADIQRNRKVYNRAIARSSFVIRSLSDETEKLKAARSCGKLSDFAFGLTSLARFIVNPDACETFGQKLSIVLGTASNGLS